MDSKAKIIFYPEFKSAVTLYDNLLRASWYLGALADQLEEISFFYQGDLDNTFSVPEYLDQKTEKIKEDISSLWKIRDSSIKLKDLKEADYIFVHDENERNKLLALASKNNLSIQVVRVDHNQVQYADSFYLKFSERFPKLHSAYRCIAQERVGRFLKPLRNDKCYLFGTGPNFSLTETYDFSDGLVIACNSMAINRSVIERLNPSIFVIADPIFHAGPSSYAGTFRKAFLDLMLKRNCPIIVPLRDFHIYSSYFPQPVVERLIPLEFKPLGDASGPNLNVIRSPHVTTTSNILTLFQIPLAATLSEKIAISGCDGRPLTQNNYFWKHDKSVQINDQMALIRKAHPAFFDISYDDYYEKHITTLESWLSACELEGKVIENLTPSYIPALMNRTTQDLIPHLRKIRKAKVSVIVPIYNAALHIEECVNSILNDKIEDLEVLLIDDFSEDESLDIAKNLSEKFYEIKVFQNFHSKGVSGARNSGVELSTGQYVAFLDSDDTLPAGSLSRRVEALDRNPDFNIVHGTVAFIDEHGSPLGVEVGTKRNVSYKDMSGNPASFNTLMLRRSILHQLHFDETLTNGEDWMAFAKLLRLGNISHYVAHGGATYRVHGTSTVKKDMLGHERRLASVIDWIYSDVGPEHASYAYRTALKFPSKQDVFQSRKLNQLIWSLFSGDTALARKLVSDTGFLGWISKLPKIGKRLEVSFVRYYALPVSNIGVLPVNEKEKVQSALATLENISELGKFLGEFSNRLRLHVDRRDPASLKEANLLFREGRYHEALIAYQYLRRKDDVYKFVDFNISLCKRKQVAPLGDLS